MGVTIYHNPNCGTSRTVLGMIRENGDEPEIIEYLKNPPPRDRLVELIDAMQLPVRSVIRTKNDLYKALHLADEKWSDDELIDFMIANPVLIERPIVVAPKGVRLCRPAERVMELLR